MLTGYFDSLGPTETMVSRVNMDGNVGSVEKKISVVSTS